jgi:hypothetical protein
MLIFAYKNYSHLLILVSWLLSNNIVELTFCVQIFYNAPLYIIADSRVLPVHDQVNWIYEWMMLNSFKHYNLYTVLQLNSKTVKDIHTNSSLLI